MKIIFDTKEEMYLFIGGLIRDCAGKHCPNVLGLSDHCENERCGQCWSAALEDISYFKKGDKADESM